MSTFFSIGSTWTSLALPTMQTAFVPASTSERRLGSSSAFAPALRVLPNATSCARSGSAFARQRPPGRLQCEGAIQTLREIDAMSYEQIAQAMETTVPSVKSLLVRARIGLAKHIRRCSCTR